MADPCRLVVLLSGSGSNLQAFIDHIQRGELPAVIAGVISNRADAGGLQRAAAANIDTAVLDHKTFSSREAFDAALLARLNTFAPDLVILAGFMRILTPVFVQPLIGRLLNIHPSLLPNYPGLNTHQRAIDAGDTQAGATVHFVTEELDGGPPIVQARVPIQTGDSAALLAERVLQQEHRIYPLAARWFAQGRLQLRGNRAFLDNAPLPATGYDYGEGNP
jgi:phosphoribosylglycinamide formyltransferase 1